MSSKSEWYFPKEIWYIIKSFEFQMKFPKYIQVQALETLKFHIAMPFVLQLHRYKHYPEQLNFIKKNQPLLWDIFSDKYITGFIGFEIYKNKKIYFETSINM